MGGVQNMGGVGPGEGSKALGCGLWSVVLMAKKLKANKVKDKK